MEETGALFVGDKVYKEWNKKRNQPGRVVQIEKEGRETFYRCEFFSDPEMTSLVCRGSFSRDELVRG